MTEEKRRLILAADVRATLKGLALPNIDLRSDDEIEDLLWALGQESINLMSQYQDSLDLPRRNHPEIL